MPVTLKPIGSGDRIDGDEGESFTRFRVCEVEPLDASDDDISEAVREEFPAEHCQHSYDCCGQFYPSSATWTRVKKWGDTTTEILIRQTYAANV